MHSQLIAEGIRYGLHDSTRREPSKLTHGFFSGLHLMTFSFADFALYSFTAIIIAMSITLLRPLNTSGDGLGDS